MKFPGSGARCCRVGLSLEIALCKTSIDITRANAINPNSLFAVVDGHGFCQADDGRLGGAVPGAHGFNKKSVYRRHINDASPRFSQMRHEEFRAQKDAAEVNADFAIPLFQCGILYRLVNLNGGVVKESVNLRKGFEGLSNQPFD